MDDGVGGVVVGGGMYTIIDGDGDDKSSSMYNGLMGVVGSEGKEILVSIDGTHGSVVFYFFILFFRFDL